MYIKKTISKRTNKEYTALFATVNGRDIILSFDRNVIFQLLRAVGLTERDYYMLDVDEKLELN